MEVSFEERVHGKSQVLQRRSRVEFSAKRKCLEGGPVPPPHLLLQTVDHISRGHPILSLMVKSPHKRKRPSPVLVISWLSRRGCAPLDVRLFCLGPPLFTFIWPQTPWWLNVEETEEVIKKGVHWVRRVGLVRFTPQSTSWRRVSRREEGVWEVRRRGVGGEGGAGNSIPEYGLI